MNLLLLQSCDVKVRELETAAKQLPAKLDPLRRRAVLSIGESLDLTARRAEYERDRKRAVEAAFRGLEDAYLLCIKEYIDERID